MDCVTDAYVTLEHQWCCVTLAASETMLIRFCAGNFSTRHCNRRLTVNLPNKDWEVPLDILLACVDKLQGRRVPNEDIIF